MRSICTEIEIRASRGRVWEILADLAGYAAWNPLIPEARGEVKVGSLLRVQIQPPGMSRSRYTLQVTGVEVPREFRWLGHFGLPGLMDGDHRLLLEEAGVDRTRLVHAETFSGLLVPLCGRWLVGRMRRGFEAMNEALKSRAEGGATTAGARPCPGGVSSLNERVAGVC